MTLYRKKYDNNFTHDQNKNRSNFTEENESTSDYLDIWDIIPSYKDINSKLSIRKSIVVVILLTFFLTSIYIVANNFNIAIFLTGFVFASFIVSFSDNFLHFRNFIVKKLQNIKVINPFEGFTFWQLKNETETLLILNKKDAITIATRIFRIDTLPENVHPTLNQFIKALSQARIQYTYQIIQNPIINIPDIIHEKRKPKIQRDDINNIKSSFQTSIYFTIYRQEKGILTKGKLISLFELTEDYSKELKSNFSANFHHTKITLLSGNDLINALRTVICEQTVEISQKQNDFISSRRDIKQVFIKAVFLSFIVGFASFLLVKMRISVGFIILIDLIIEFSIILYWWRDLFYIISKTRMNRHKQLDLIDPFHNFRFFRFNGARNSLFILINRQLLLVKKMFNLQHAYHPSLVYPDKFFRALINHKIPFTYTLNAIPIYVWLFCKQCLKFLNIKTYKALDGIIYYTLDQPDARKVRYPRAEFDNWLNMRSGIWKTNLTLSTTSYKLSNKFKFEDFIELEKAATTNSKILRKTFEDNFLTFKLMNLYNTQLISGFMSETLKNPNFWLRGSHLNYLYFQGKKLMELTKVVNEFKKGIETRVAAEFNTPMQLDNYISIGQTINTEFLEEEVPLGFTFDQLKRLLITNGIASSREFIQMIIVSELIKSNISCVIFDYSGNWSKLIRYFDQSQYQNNILHFKLGSSFSIDIKNSGIKYDKNNLDYLNLFYDVFALAFKEQKRNVDVLKETILKNDELDLSSITLDLQVKDKLQKPYSSNSLLMLFKDFVEQSNIFSNKALEYEEEINPIDFIKNDKTIIIDLSILKDLEKKTFISFAILSKFIHYMENSDDYNRKIISIPNIDMFFDSHYIDTHSDTVNYGTIDKFIEALLKRGFGMISSANQIRYLHTHVLNFFQNIISLKATDPRDIAVLKNQMKLQELQGTGYYSSKRNNTYQIDYLMNMRDEEIIVKRSDIFQPFPGIFNINKFKEIPLMTNDEILTHMENQGYKLRQSERKIIARAKKTLFEKDFGIYFGFIEEIINFLKVIKTIDNVAGLYKKKLKDELIKYIWPKASKKVQDKINIKEIRDDIFALLVKHGYLVENHPKSAGGNESLRTSYSVGSHYHKSLQDYFNTRGNTLSDNAIETNLVNDSDFLTKIQEETNRDMINVKKFHEIYSKQNSELNWILFRMYESIENNEFEKALNIGENLIKNYILNLQISYLKFDNNSVLEIEDSEFFYEHLSKTKLFPLSVEDIKRYHTEARQIISSNEGIEMKAKDLYDILSRFCSILLS
ncbi:MAG: hypothetical protein ACFFFT_01940 [Candidatus Thorarchaeota archaeon]